MADKLPRNAQLIGSLVEKASGKPLTAISVRVEGLKETMTTDKSGVFKAKLKSGKYSLVFAVRGASIKCNVNIHAGKNQLLFATDFNRKSIVATEAIKRDGGEIYWNEPIVLLPMQLQIRKVKKLSSIRLATMTKERVRAFPTPSGNFQPFKPKITIDDKLFSQEEYWIRWYPDEIHHLHPIGRITESEKESWKTFWGIFENIKLNYPQYQSLTSFMSSIDVAQWSLVSLDVNIEADRNKIIDWLKKYYGLSNGDLNIAETRFCAQYDKYCVPLVNNGTIGYRVPLEWMDMENRDLKTGWVSLCAAVGTKRARQLSKYFLSSDDWDFDTIYPLYAGLAYAPDLDRGTFPQALKREIEATADITFSRCTEVRQATKGWIIADEKTRLILVRGSENISIYNERGEEQEALAMLLDRGAKVPTLPDEVGLFCIDDKGALTLIQDKIKINRKDIRISATELKGSHWAANFDDAIRDGMGIKISDSEKVNKIKTSSWLLLAGINKNADGREALEQIFRRNHALSDLGIMAQDSPTNNTEHGKTDHEEIPRSPEELVLTTRMAVTADTGYSQAKLDANKVAALFKLEPSTVSEIQGSELNEQEQAWAMNLLVWNSLHRVLSEYSYELRRLLDVPLTEMTALENQLKVFFLNHVRGRGTLPILRVGENPYGVLPVIPAHNLNRSGKFPGTNDSDNGLLNGLLSLKKIFLHMAKAVPSVDEKSVDPYNDLVAILQQRLVSSKLRASTVEIDVRSFTDPFIKFVDLEFSGNSKKVNCPNVTEPVSSTESDPTAAYPFYPQTSYLHDGFVYPELRRDLVIDNKSPVLKRMLASAINHLKTARHSKEELEELSKACDVLKRIHPHKLEILFFETLDLFSHRLDAWFTGIADQKLSDVIESTKTAPPVGVFGWLQKPGEIDDDPANVEFVYCPSDQHAIAACMLRAGTLSTNPGNDKQPFQINLNSSRARRGLWFLDGLRKKYTSEMLLGSELERMIYAAAKAGAPSIMPDDIYTLREMYPLPLGETRDSNGSLISRSTMINGEKFIQLNTDTKYQNLKDTLRSIKDAAADVVIGNTMFHQGNADRQAAWMDFLDGKILPPEDEFVRTRRTGTPLLSQVFLTFGASAMTAANSTTSPRSIADPILEELWQSFVSGFAQKKVKVKLTRDEKIVEYTFDTHELNVQPIDILLGGLEELTTTVRYFVMTKWKKATATDPVFSVLGSFPSTESPEEILSTTEVKFMEPSATELPNSLLLVIQKARSFKSAILYDPTEGSQTVNPALMPLNFDKNIYKADASATIDILKKRFEALQSLYRNLLLDLIDKTAPLLATIAVKLGATKLRKLIGRAKDEPINNSPTTFVILEQTWFRIISVVPEVGTAAGTGWLQALKQHICLPPTDAAVLQKAIDDLLKFELIVDEHLRSQLSFALRIDDPLLARLAAAGIRRPQLGPLTGHSQPILSVRLMIETIADLFEKVEHMVDGQGNLPTMVRRLKISILQSEELMSVVDANDLNLLNWNVECSTRLQDIARISPDDATSICSGWQSSLASYTTFVYTQTGAIRSDGSPQMLLPVGIDDEGGIEWIKKALKAATDGEAIPIWRPWLLSAGTQWPIDLGAESTTASANLDIYAKVRPKVESLNKILSGQTGFHFFETNTIGGVMTTQKSMQYIAAKSNSIVERCLCIVKIDSWTEVIPSREERTALALHFESPKNECPNAVIVAVPPKLDNNIEWSNSQLAEVLKETIELMQVRMVTSEQVKSHNILGNFLPALIFSDQNDFVPTTPWISVTDIGRFIYWNKNDFTPQEMQDVGTYSTPVKPMNLKIFKQ